MATALTAAPLRDSPAAPVDGLTTAEAALRLQRDGFNELPSARPRTSLAIALDVVREPMFLLLIATGAIYLLLGDSEEALALLVAVFLIIGITLYQEQKTERALEALRDLSSPRALVIRDGIATRVPGREVVCGDVVVLREGDRVPADATIDWCPHLLVDESLLTGESVPVRKRAGEDRLYSGTLVVRGEGRARVYAIGAATELGKIGAAIGRIEVGRTALQREVGRVVRLLAALGLGACVALGVGYGIARHYWVDGALAGLTLAISMVPEEFPVVLTVFLALGAWRISRSRVLTRRIPAIETLGSATVLCVDKTGTLTMNRMTVEMLAADDERRLIATALLASKTAGVDPMDRAIGDRALELGETPPSDAMLLREYPLTDSILAVTHVWRRNWDAHAYDVAAKGAPEAVAALCGLPADSRARLMDRVNRMAADGLRVLAVAGAEWHGASLPDSVVEFPFVFAGLIGFADPVRPGVPEAIDECRSAHIRVVMITGDYPATAMHVARAIRLRHADVCVTGSEIALMSDRMLRERIRDVDVFARVPPEMKLRLVAALKSNDEVVAMTGDGVNDAPALKAADIGVAMGMRGTDVAREAAALVLLDDDFSSIVRAVRLGRRIYDNIEKATAYILATHVPIAGMSLLPVLIGEPLVLLPVNVLFMELISDPACSIAFEMEPDERDVMRRPPRRPSQRLFTRRLVAQSLLQGAGAFAACAAVFALALHAQLAEAAVRTTTFATLIVTNLALIAANRSLTRPLSTHGQFNPVAWVLSGAAIVVLALIFSVPFLKDLFRVSSPGIVDVLVVAAAGAAAVVWMEGVKWMCRSERREPC